MSDKRAEFSEKLQQGQTQIFSYIYSLVRDMDDADDVFQQTGLALWRKYEQYDPSRSFVAWACGMARYEVSNFLRSRSRDRLYFSDDLNILLIESWEAVANESQEERLDALAGCIDKLRQRDRELLEACYRRSIRVPKIAESWGRSPQSIHNSLKRIREVALRVRPKIARPGGAA